MTDIVERIKDAENATRALYNHIFQDAREEIERLRIENEALRAEVIHIKEVEFPRKAQAVADGWRGKCERLEAKIEAMEKQEPVAWTTKLALEYGASRLGFQVSGVNMWGENGVPLYALPGAQPALSEQDESVRKAWARLSNELHRGPDAPYPGMSEAFEQHFSQSMNDREWRAEAATWAAAWKAAKSHCAQPTPSVPECPYPCGWRNLLKHAIEDGAYLARSINEDEPVTENARAVTMRMVILLRDVLMAINNTAPEAKP